MGFKIATTISLIWKPSLTFLNRNGWLRGLLLCGFDEAQKEYKLTQSWLSSCYFFITPWKNGICCIYLIQMAVFSFTIRLYLDQFTSIL